MRHSCRNSPHALDGLRYSSKPISIASENLEQAAREARLAFFRDADARSHPSPASPPATPATIRPRPSFSASSAVPGTAGISRNPPGAHINERHCSPADRDPPRRNRTIPSRPLAFPGATIPPTSPIQFARNRIRRDLLPNSSANGIPALRDTLVQTADWARAEESYWKAEIDRLAGRCLTESSGFVLIDVE